MACKKDIKKKLEDKVEAFIISELGTLSGVNPSRAQKVLNKLTGQYKTSVASLINEGGHYIIEVRIPDVLVNHYHKYWTAQEELEKVTPENIFDLTEFEGTLIEYVDHIGLKPDGREIAARNIGKGEKIQVVLSAMREKFQNKTWTAPATSEPMPEDMFSTVEEFMLFMYLHEKGHEYIFREENESIGSYETRVNNEAIRRLRSEFKDFGKKPAETLFFQTTNEKKKAIKALDGIVHKWFKDVGIEEISVEEYKKRHKDRLGKDIDPIALADILNQVVAYAAAKIDGTSLLEEAFHFIVDTMWNTPEMKVIRNGRAASGKRWIESTQEWLSGYKEYKALYKDAEMIDKEVVTKILTNYTYKTFKQGQYNTLNRLQKWLKRFIDAFKGKVSKRADIIPKEIELVIGKVAFNFINGTLPYTTTKPDRLFVSEVTKAEDTTANVADVAMKALVGHRRKKMLDSRNLIDKFVKSIFDDLRAKYPDLDVQEMIDMVNKYTSMEAGGRATADQIRIKNELISLLEMFAKNKQQENDLYEIKSLSKQISRLTATIDQKLYDYAVKIFIMGTPELVPVMDMDGNVHQEVVTMGGIKDQFTEALELVKKEEPLTSNEYMRIIDFLKAYEPIIRQLSGLVLTTPNLFSELSKTEKDDLVSAIKNASERVTEIQDRMDKIHKSVVAGYIREFREARGGMAFIEISPEDMANDIQFDKGGMSRMFGVGSNALQWQIGAFTRLVAEIKNGVLFKTQDASLPVYKQVLEANKLLADHPTIKRLIKLHGLNRVEQLFLEFNKDKPKQTTGYIANPYNINAWNDNMAIASEEIITKMEGFIKSKYGKEVFIPRGQDPSSRRIRHAWFKEDTIDVGDTDRTIKKKYDNLWAEWFELNTIEHPDAAKIMKQRKDEMSKVEYAEWLDLNTHNRSWVDGAGNEHFKQILVGELSVPSDGSNKKVNTGKITKIVKTTNYSNSEFNELMVIPEFKKLYDSLLSLKHTADDKLPAYISSSYEYRFRAPQISKSVSDILYNTSAIFKGGLKDYAKDVREKLGDAVKVRKDDEIAAGRLETGDELLDNTLPNINTPPVRFVKKLENPNLLSRDVMSSLVMYSEMATSYKDYSANLREFNFIREATSSAEFKDSGKTVKGSESGTLKMLDALTKIFVYGEDVEELKFDIGGKEINATKLSKSFLNLIRNAGLMGNFPAIGTGFVMATSELFIEQLIGRTVTPESTRWSSSTFAKNLHSIVRDMELPIKRNKVSLLMNRIGLMTSNREIFKNLDKSRAFRTVEGVLDYGIWKMADFMPKAKAMLAIMDNYRNIGGNWYTREEFLMGGGSKEDWSGAREKSFYNSLDMSDGELTTKPGVVIKSQDWDFIINRTTLLARDIDSTASDLDRTAASANNLLRYVLPFRKWMHLGWEKRFKRRHPNMLTEKYEEGSYRFLMDIFSNREESLTLNELLFNFQSLQPEQKEGFKRTLLEIARLNLFFLMAYLVNSLLDDDEDDPFLQNIAYIMTRTTLEAGAFLSLSDAISLVQRPVAGVDYVSKFFEALGLLINVPLHAIGLGEDPKILQSGPYKGKSKLAKTLITMTPGVRGLYETSPVNIYLPGIGETQGAKGTRGKNTYIKNQVLNKWDPLREFMLLPSKTPTGPLSRAGK